MCCQNVLESKPECVVCRLHHREQRLVMHTNNERTRLFVRVIAVPEGQRCDQCRFKVLATGIWELQYTYFESVFVYTRVYLPNSIRILMSLYVLDHLWEYLNDTFTPKSWKSYICNAW